MKIPRLVRVLVEVICAVTIVDALARLGLWLTRDGACLEQSAVGFFVLAVLICAGEIVLAALFAWIIVSVVEWHNR